jgi:ABC-type dipeptide/oligopeptide/nickel transport system permease subunit
MRLVVGLMLKESQAFPEMYPWNAVFPGSVIAAPMIGLTLLG